jgi:hypothetical protein
MKYWVIEAKVGFWIDYCPKHWSKYHLDTLQTRFSEKNNQLGTTMVKILFVHVWKCFILGVFHRSDFWHLIWKSALILSKWLFFQNSLPHNNGICRWKNKIISECFTINNHGFSFVSFSTEQTLIVNFITQKLKNEHTFLKKYATWFLMFWGNERRQKPDILHLCGYHRTR